MSAMISRAASQLGNKNVADRSIFTASIRWINRTNILVQLVYIQKLDVPTCACIVLVMPLLIFCKEHNLPLLMFTFVQACGFCTAGTIRQKRGRLQGEEATGLPFLLHQVL